MTGHRLGMIPMIHFDRAIAIRRISPWFDHEIDKSPNDGGSTVGDPAPDE